jgi:TRAP-type C4-dicarboxylate transport system substrate-binding protein
VNRNLSKTLLGIVAALVLSVSAHATEWTMVSGYADDNFMTRNLRELIADVEQQTGGEFKIKLHSNGTLIKLDGIRRAVQSGQVQMGEIRLGVYGNEDPMYVLDGIPFLANGYGRAWTLMNTQSDYFDRMFGRLSLKAIAFQPWPGQGFYTKDKVTSLEDFKGKRLRVYSKYTQMMGDMLGFQTTTLPFSEIPQAFATGLIDALFTSPQIGIDTQAWDNTRYYTIVGALNTKNAIVVNRRAFDRLPPKQQEALSAAGKRASERGWKHSEQTFHEQLEILRKNGMVVQHASDTIMAEMHRIGGVLTDEWRKEASPEALKVLDQYLATQ